MQRCLYQRALALALAALLKPSAAASWAPDRAIDEGTVLRLVPDGSRICAATRLGVYCRERDQESWHPAYFAGRHVSDLARTRFGWVAFLYKPDTTAGSSGGTKTYISRDHGASWSQAQVAWSPDATGPQGSGDSLIRYDREKVELSPDGGQTWRPFSRPSGAIWACTLAPGSVICATESQIIANAGTANWTTLGTMDYASTLYASQGRIYAQDTLGVLSVFGAGGLERKMPPVPGYYLFFASDSLLIANSTRGYAYARAKETAWTLTPAPSAYAPSHSPGGVQIGPDAIVLGFNSPWKARFEGGKIHFEPFGRGIPNLHIGRLSASGHVLFATTPNAIWRSDADGAWKSVFWRESVVSRFFILDGNATVSSFWIDGYIDAAAPSRFSVDSGKTWRDQPASLPGLISGMARVGDRYLAITRMPANRDSGSTDSGYLSLHESEAWMGPWAMRAEYGSEYAGDLIACGPRLFSHRLGDAWTSLDTGKTWSPTGYARVLEAGGDRVYALDSAGALWEARHCVEPWARIPVPLQDDEWPWAISRTVGEPLVAVYSEASGASRVYPLPGASSQWAGIEAYPLPGLIESLASRGGMLYAAVWGAGLHVLDPNANGMRTRPSPRLSGNSRRISGWRRVDGRAFPAGASSSRTPLFRSGRSPALP